MESKIKISDVIVTNHDGKIVICHKNKRGNIKSDYNNITTEFLDCITTTLVSKEGRIYLHTDANGKHYAIDIKEMSKEEFFRREKSKKARGRKALASLQSLLASTMMNLMR